MSLSEAKGVGLRASTTHFSNETDLPYGDQGWIDRLAKRLKIRHNDPSPWAPKKETV